jgi:hypothetical protein
MTQADRVRKDAKRQRRQVAVAAKREEQHLREVGRRRRTLLTYGGIAGALVVVIGLVVAMNQRNRSGLAEVPGGEKVAAGVSQPAAKRGVVEHFDDQGGTHIQLGRPHPAYNSDPPTSGWHTPQTANWGAFRNAIPDQIIVHNLEHGGIWISYSDPKDTTLVEKLETLTARYRSKVILTPRSGNDAPIVVAAWTRLMKLDTYDEEKIVRFIDAFKNKGPESVPD